MGRRGLQLSDPLVLQNDLYLQGALLIMRHLKHFIIFLSLITAYDQTVIIFLGRLI